MFRKDVFALDHPRGSVFKNGLSDEFLPLKSPNRNSSDLQVFEFFPRQHVQKRCFCIGSSSWIPRNDSIVLGGYCICYTLKSFLNRVGE